MKLGDWRVDLAVNMIHNLNLLIQSPPSYIYSHFDFHFKSSYIREINMELLNCEITRLFSSSWFLTS